MRHRDGFYFNVNLKGNNLLFLLTNVHLSCNVDLLAAPHPPLHLLNSRCAASGMGMCAFFLSAVSRLGRRNVPAGSNFCRLCGAARLADTSEGDMDAQRLCFNYLCVSTELFFLSFGTEVGGSPTFWVFDLQAWWPC